MTAENLASTLRRELLAALALKDLPRAGWTRVGVDAPESVAAHSWGVAWLVLVLCPDTLDRGRALAIATVHDLAEVVVGDLTPHDGVSAEEKFERERSGMSELTRRLPNGDELCALWREYADASTAEGRFVKACDKLDMALMAARYEATQGVDTAEFIDSALAALDDAQLRALVTEDQD